MKISKRKNLNKLMVIIGITMKSMLKLKESRACCRTREKIAALICPMALCQTEAAMDAAGVL